MIFQSKMRNGSALKSAEEKLRIGPKNDYYKNKYFN